MKRKILKLLYYLKSGSAARELRIRYKKNLIRRKYFHDDEKYLSELYNIYFGKYPNIQNPKTYNEKLLWLKLFWRDDLAYQCADKIRVRDYVAQKGLERILVPLVGTFSHIKQIDKFSLPERFVIKTNNDSGGVFICKDKNDEKKYNKSIYKIQKRINKNRVNPFKEWVYDRIEPKILIEEIVKTKDGNAPKDYKFFCFHGEPAFLYVASERERLVKFTFFDLDWNHLKIINGHDFSNHPIEKPSKFNEMVEICRILSRDFPHVRVDLYYENDTIYFSELTFFHHGGNFRFIPESFDQYAGSLLDINKIINSPKYHSLQNNIRNKKGIPS